MGFPFLPAIRVIFMGYNENPIPSIYRSNTMKTKLSAVKNHVIRHRAMYASATTATVLVGFYMRTIVPEWREFCIEQGVFDAWNDHLAEGIE